MTALRLAFGAFFAVTGVSHFVAAGYYHRQVPPWVPRPRRVVAVSGALELSIGVALAAGWQASIMAGAAAGLLIAYLPVHVHAWRTASTPSRRRREALRFPVNGIYVAVAVAIAVLD